MNGCLLANKYLQLFKNYPEREYPDEIKNPDPTKPYNPKKKKKVGNDFRIPKWAEKTEVLEN